LTVCELYCSVPVNAVSRQGSGVGRAIGLGLYLKKGILNGKTKLPKPNATVVIISAIAIAVSGRTRKRKSIPSFPMILAHHLFM